MTLARAYQILDAACGSHRASGPPPAETDLVEATARLDAAEQAHAVDPAAALAAALAEEVAS